MTTPRLNHFLIVYDIPGAHAHVKAFGHEYTEALRAYAEAEAKYQDNNDVEVVLLGSDSLQTLERTHSSYFELSEGHIDRIVARDLAELGLS